MTLNGIYNLKVFGLNKHLKLDVYLIFNFFFSNMYMVDFNSMGKQM